MVRSLLGFAALAVIAGIVLKLFGVLVFSLIGLALFVLKLAFIGFVVYLILKLFAPDTAAKVKETIRGS
jgi:predicted lipid-binding transport protein (Tim44 family)